MHNTETGESLAQPECPENLAGKASRCFLGATASAITVSLILMLLGLTYTRGRVLTGESFLGNDDVSYAVIAESIHLGRGRASNQGTITAPHQPVDNIWHAPGISLAAQPLMQLGLPSYSALPLLNMVFIALFAGFLHHQVELRRGRRVAWLSSLVFLLPPVVWGIGLSSLSEPLFLFIAGLMILMAGNRAAMTYRRAIVLGVLSGALYWTRYIGIMALPLLVVWAYFDYMERRKASVLATWVVALGTATLLVTALAASNRLAGGVGLAGSSSLLAGSKVSMGLMAQNWLEINAALFRGGLLPISVFDKLASLAGGPILLELSSSAIILALLISPARLALSALRDRICEDRVPLVASTFSILYLLTLWAAHLVSVHGEASLRMLLPAFPLFCVAAAHFLDRVLRAPLAALAVGVVLAGFVGLSCVQLWRGHSFENRALVTPAGEWIRANLAPDAVCYVQDEWSMLLPYVGGRMLVKVPTPPETQAPAGFDAARDMLMEHSRLHGIHHVVLVPSYRDRRGTVLTYSEDNLGPFVSSLLREATSRSGATGPTPPFLVFDLRELSSEGGSPAAK